MTQPTYHLALRDLHAAAGAVFDVRGGWSLPAHYGDREEEYRRLRERAALFDRSHQSRFIVSGTDALEVLEGTFEGHLRELEEGRAMRTVALQEGRISDLVLVSRTGGISYIVIGQPGRRFHTAERLAAAKQADFDARIDDRTESTCLLSLTGPDAAAVAARHLGESLPSRVRFMQSAAFEFHGFRAFATRTTDTGDDGFLFMLAPAVAQHLVETLSATEAPLAGDDVHTIARVEACIPAFEPDLEQGITPAEADLDALLEIAGGSQARLLSAILIDGDDPVGAGTPVFQGDTGVGEVRSCVYSPGLRATIGLALLLPDVAAPGTQLGVPGRGVTVAAKPLLRRRVEPS